jgi:hypothetical protein
MMLHTDIPMDPVENMEWRMFMRNEASKSAALRAEITQACRNDVLYFLKGWSFLHEPREMEENGVALPRVIPFLVWEHQEPVILEIKKNLGLRDIGIEKSRGEGMSWIGLMLALHQWLFEEDPVNIGMVSSTEKKADTPGNMDSLMAKLDWELLQLPSWMSGKLDTDYTRNKSDHTLVNLRNNSQIVAFAASSGGPRGGRYTWFLMDELSSWDRGPDDEVMKSSQQATKSRLVISTPLGSDGAYYKFMHTSSNLVKKVLDWKDNPSRNRGLYRIEGVKAIAVDPENNPLFPEYVGPSPEVADKWDDLRKRGFILENRVRSPWYDDECHRADSTPQSIAQELDRDYGGSVTKFFGETVDAILADTVQPPIKRYEISVNSALDVEWDVKPNGSVSLWCELDMRGHPPKGQYTLNADVATGQGGKYSSNSVITIINANTGEQVLEYATNQIPALDLADHAVALAKLFYDAYLGWEHMGPGVAFGTRILNHHYYGRCFQRYTSGKNGGKKKTKDYGFITRGDMRILGFEELKDFILKKKLLVRSSAAAAEFPQYIEEPGPKIHHVQVKGESDAAHGDRVIALLVGVQALQDIMPNDMERNEQVRDDAPMGTLAYREHLYELSQEANDEWDDRSTADFRKTVA